MAKGSGGDRNIASARSSQLDDADTPSVQASARPMRRETDPSKPLRPNGYASRRALSGLRSSIAGKEGLLLIGTAQLLYSTMALFFKLLHDLPEGRENPISALEVIFIRMGITYIGCVSYMVLSSTPHPFLGPPEVRWLLLLRGAVGFVGLGSFYYSLQYLSLSDATVITFLSPFATSWLAWAVLGESFSTRQTLAGMASLAGVVLIARPSFLFGKLADDELEMPVGDEALRALQILHASTSSSSSAQSVLASSTSTSTASIASATIAVLRSTSDQARRAALGALVGFLQGRDERSSHAASSLTPRDEISEEQRLLAVFVALAGVLGSSGAYCTIRASQANFLKLT
ncbi:Permease of the drug/metabolite transporter (DMT) superfamily [Ceraceosorus bombacis]|uniref:Permease of the drug/metabolite transporter (DMT) superfamily n=1 Tax=Ceraceosorus bombacis TaxID=401625 RepID=A0A0P1BRS1_9BASI|nr:Permease of the drug/metabolite transporter (DMT) superfamily [Ceraceosorus bombacis]